MYCTGIKHFEFYIGHKEAKVSSWESALKITKDFMWDCLRSFYLLFLPVFKYLLSVWNAFGCHSLKSVVETSGAAGHTPRGYTWRKKRISIRISKANVTPVPSTHVCQEVSSWSREAVSHVLVKGKMSSYYAEFPQQGTPRSRSRRGFRSQPSSATVLSRNLGYQWLPHMQVLGASFETPCLGTQVNSPCSWPLLTYQEESLCTARSTLDHITASWLLPCALTPKGCTAKKTTKVSFAFERTYSPQMQRGSLPFGPSQNQEERWVWTSGIQFPFSALCPPAHILQRKKNQLGRGRQMRQDEGRRLP